MSRHDRQLEAAAMLGAGLVTIAFLALVVWIAGRSVGSW